VSDVRGVRLSFRSPGRVAVASVWAAVGLAGGVGMAWSERADLWSAVFLGALSGVNLLTAVRIAASRVWTEGCRLHVRNPIRRYTLEADQISGFAIARTSDSYWLGSDGPLVLTDDGRRLLLYSLGRAYATWRASGTATEAYRIEQLEAWHVRCRWELGEGRAKPPPPPPEVSLADRLRELLGRLADQF
jgi:hypothetical protein